MVLGWGGGVPGLGLIVMADLESDSNPQGNPGGHENSGLVTNHVLSMLLLLPKNRKPI